MNYVLTRQLSILEGPPGVGKSKVLGMAAILKILMDPELTGQIVLTAHSNKAVEVLLSALISMFETFASEFPVLKDVTLTRAYPNRLLLNDQATHAKHGLFQKTMDQNPELAEVFSAYQANTFTVPKQIRAFWNFVRQAQSQVLRQSRIIALTHNMCAKRHVKDPNSNRMFYNSELQWDDVEFRALADTVHTIETSRIVFERSDIAAQKTFSSVTSNRSPIEASSDAVHRFCEQDQQRRQNFRQFGARAVPQLGLTYLLTIFLLMGQIFLGLARNTYNLCGHGRSGYALRLPEKVTCNIKGPNTQPKIFEGDIYVPRDFPMQFRAFSCYLYEHVVDTYQNVFFSKNVLKRETRSMPLNATMCRQLHETKTYMGQQLNRVSEGLWATNNSQPTAFKWCCYTVRTRVLNVILEYGHIDTRDGTTLMSNLGDAGGCWPMRH